VIVVRAIVAIAGGVICGAIFWPTVDRPGATSQANCISHIKQLALANLMYAANYDDVLPDRDHWVDQAWPYAKDTAIFKCPGVGQSVYGYAFNSKLSHKKVPVEADTTPLVYDSVNEARNASDPFTSLPKPGRHNGQNVVAYADAHAKSLRAQ